ncbi:hypothetical protein QO259_10805 [Salinicola sp. JS01]|uniref:hypothetical protein n=1 Tax=Salinicola sp. JS01 TaxID=3050071 RepID=UPI00255C0DE3|nr:hypothetical protein [Salinicola sp. JS01]WIX31322.1 hypothetical protein QO259_10805 [Salinicola sp. JS01]
MAVPAEVDDVEVEVEVEVDEVGVDEAGAEEAEASPVDPDNPLAATMAASPTPSRAGASPVSSGVARAASVARS